MAYYNAKPIHLALQPSQWLARTLPLACLVACLALLLSPVGAWLKAWFMAAAIVATVYEIRLHALLALQSSITALRLDRDARVEVTMRCGDTLEVKVLESSFVSVWLTVLNLQVCGQSPLKRNRRIHLLLLPDNTEPESFRQLRVWLRWGQETAEN